MYKGSNEITKAYLGIELIYQNTPPATVDNNTIRLFHFDEGNNINVMDIKDSARLGMCGSGAGGSTTTTDSNPKFGASCWQNGYTPNFYNMISSSQDWSVDMWAMFLGGDFYICSGTCSWSGTVSGHGIMFDKHTNKIKLFNSSPSTVVESVDYTFNTTDWYHLAVCRDITNSKTYVFVNGTKVMEVTDSTANPSQNMVIGSNFGRVDELRVSDNVRYTADFDVPTAEYSYDTKEHYTLVGGLTVTSDYEISGFDDGKYAYIMNPFKFGTNATSFELKTAVKLAATSSTETVIFDSFWPDSTTPAQFIRLTKNSSNCVRLRICTDGSAGASATYAVDIAGSTTIPVDTKFYIKVNFDTTNGYKLYTSTDGSTWVLEGSSAVTTLPYNADNSATAMKIGSRYRASSSYGYNWNGSIYMEDTYISFDNNFRWDAVKVESV